MGVHEVSNYFGLGTDHDLFATGEVLQINMVTAAIKAQGKTAMRQHFMVHANSFAGGIKQLSRALRKHAGMNAGLRIALAALVNPNGVDAKFVEQLPE